MREKQRSSAGYFHIFYCYIYLCSVGCVCLSVTVYNPIFVSHFMNTMMKSSALGVRFCSKLTKETANPTACPMFKHKSASDVFIFSYLQISEVSSHSFYL